MKKKLKKAVPMEELLPRAFADGDGKVAVEFEVASKAHELSAYVAYHLGIHLIRASRIANQVICSALEKDGVRA